MHPALTQQMALEHIALMRRDAVRHRRTREAKASSVRPIRAAIELRISACRDELERLAALSDRSVRGGEWLVGDVDGVPVAAVSLEDGSTVYDPFKPTTQVVSLLQLRRKQVLARAY